MIWATWASQPNTRNEYSALYVRHTIIPSSDAQFARLQLCPRVPYMFHVSRPNPTVQTIRMETLATRLRSGERNVQE